MLHFALLLALDEDLMPGEAAAGKMLLNKAIMIWHVSSKLWNLPQV